MDPLKILNFKNKIVGINNYQMDLIKDYAQLDSDGIKCIFRIYSHRNTIKEM